MKYLKQYQNQEEYDQEVGTNGYARIPNVAIIDESDTVKYISNPLRELSYKGPTNLFYDNINVKKIMANNKVIYENTNERQWKEIIIQPENCVVNSNGTIQTFAPEFLIDVSSLPLIEVTVDGGLQVGDGCWLISKWSGETQLLGLGGHFSQNDINNGVWSNLFYPEDLLVDNKITYQVVRDGTPLKTIIRYYGVEPFVNTIIVQGTPLIPRDIYIDYVIIESINDLDYQKDFLYFKMNGEFYDVIPLYDMEQNMSSPKSFKLDVQGVSTAEFEIGYCRPIFNENGELDSLDDIIYLDTKLLVANPINPSDIIINEDTTIIYEPYNRFYPVHLKGTKVTTVNANAYKHNTVNKLNQNYFQNCTELKELYIPDNITDDNDSQVLKGCNKLEVVTLPKTLKTVHSSWFEDCINLKEIICLSPTQPVWLGGAFYSKVKNGVLKVPSGSDYSTWLAYFNAEQDYNWTIEYI